MNMNCLNSNMGKHPLISLGLRKLCLNVQSLEMSRIARTHTHYKNGSLMVTNAVPIR